MAERNMDEKVPFDTDDFKPNSKSDISKKKVEVVVSEPVRISKKSGLRRVEGALVAEDAYTVREYLLWDVLIPAAKDTIVDLIKKAADAIFYGNRNPNTANIERSRGTSYVRYDKPSYDTRYDTRYDRPYRSRRSTRIPTGYEDIVLPTREDAEAVLDQLVELTYNYGVASLSDFYEMVGLESRYTDERWGWYELSRARIERSRDGGYICVLPKVEPIEYN